MKERTCDICGKIKKVEKGKTCETGHFMCYECRDVGFFNDGKTTCPICKKKVR